MKTISYLTIILFFVFSCQSASQNNQVGSDSLAVEKHDSVKVIEKTELNFYADSADIAIYEKLINYADRNNLKDKSLSEIEIEVAKQFIETPYVGQTLEKDSIESLVVNLRELDCTTFLENVLAISLCIKKQMIKFNNFCEMLVRLRYRNGQINEYPSRLHYTTDWLYDNQKKGLLSVVSNEFGTDDLAIQVNFMSTHSKNYKQLANPLFVEEMKKHESRISEIKMKYIPKDKINLVAPNIKDGDMIAISTTIAGLDFSHVVLAAWKNNKLHFIHASVKDKKVVFSDKPLQDYLAGIKSNRGIVVARLN